MLRILLMAFTALAAASAQAAPEVGRVTKAQMDAYQAEGVLGYVIGPQAPIFQNARVFTKDFGSVQIKLKDDTDLLISPNSSLVIDSYIFDGTPSGSDFAMRLTKGALRVISGRMAKPAQSVGTAVAQIGVRGTTYWLDVDVPGVLRIWVDEGAIVARPLQSDQEFVFEAPAYAECTVTTCALTDPPPKPLKFPFDPRGR